MKRIKIINGPNLNMLGKRDKKIYGAITFEELIREISKYSQYKSVEIESFQSNHEGEIIEEIHRCVEGFDGLIINPGALTHYSYSIRDAIEILECPVVEVHISNIASREEFRNKSVISPVCTGTITGLGWKGYLLAIDYFAEIK